MLQGSYSSFRQNVGQHTGGPQLVLSTFELINMCDVLPKKKWGYKIIVLLKIFMKETPLRKFRNTDSPNN